MPCLNISGVVLDIDYYHLELQALHIGNHHFPLPYWFVALMSLDLSVSWPHCLLTLLFPDLQATMAMVKYFWSSFGHWLLSSWTASPTNWQSSFTMTLLVHDLTVVWPYCLLTLLFLDFTASWPYCLLTFLFHDLQVTIATFEYFWSSFGHWLLSSWTTSPTNRQSSFLITLLSIGLLFHDLTASWPYCFMTSQQIIL